MRRNGDRACRDNTGGIKHIGTGVNSRCFSCSYKASNLYRVTGKESACDVRCRVGQSLSANPGDCTHLVCSPAPRLPASPRPRSEGAGQIRNLFQFAMLFEKSKEKSKIRTWYHKSFLSTSRLSEGGRGEVAGRRAPRRGTLFGRSMVHSLDHLPRLMLVPLALFQVSLAPTTCFRGHKVSRWQKWSLKLPGLSRPLKKTVRSISRFP